MSRWWFYPMELVVRFGRVKALRILGLGAIVL